ncbi:DgyrCDS6664 [Dimorphilus gyrociliatus]|uniref:DgyrCDS6664 n=1 Tax=Dimorphilus gyrociliatus TaxID=2664684 RepID=A0A7I8VNR0_9ANNE|nr:DgyrCDS6664 [Dimorphilus gyrociliatus]
MYVKALLLLVFVVAVSSMSLQTADEGQQFKRTQTEDDESRATWLDTREDLLSNFKNFVYSSVVELVNENKLDGSVLSAPSKDKRGRWQGFCFRRNKQGKFLPYICWKGGK